MLYQHIQTRAEGESFISDTTRARILQIACETLQFYRLICQVILKIHLIKDEKIKVKVYENQQNSVSEYTNPFTLMILLCFLYEL